VITAMNRANPPLGGPSWREPIARICAASVVVFTLWSTPLIASGEITPARPIGPFNELFSTDDYPSGALRNNASGTSAYLLTVAPDGTVAGCAITTTSGSSELDTTTCELLSRRARFEPARDEDGQPVTGSYRGRFTWAIPDSVPIFPTSVVMEFDVAANGTVENCQVRAVPDNPAAPRACDKLKTVSFPGESGTANATLHRRHVTFRNEVTVRDIADAVGKK
jgi:protein TonB